MDVPSSKLLVIQGFTITILECKLIKGSLFSFIVFSFTITILECKYSKMEH